MGDAPRHSDRYHDSQDREYKKMVREMLATTDKGFTEWEINFLDSVNKQAHTTDKQRAIIEKLYQQKM